jgi:ubiquinone biosynthesis protein
MFVQNDVSKLSLIERINEIAVVFIKYGFQTAVAKLFPDIKVHIGKQKADTSKLGVNRRLRLAIQELGPTFIKLGQIMSTRPDLFSPELITELKMLTNNVEAATWESVEPIIEEYCGSIDETFVFLSKRPFAAASISQAYLGKLKDGTVVVLKVQRPNIKTLIDVDIHILKEIAKRAKFFPELQLFNFPDVIDEFSRQILLELDFTRDGRNAELLARNMQSIEGVRIPKIYWKYSGQRLLVMEYMKGVRVDKLEQIKKMNVDPKKIALSGFHAYWKQIFEDGFFHGDPHPGNLLVTPQQELVFLDFGLFGVIRPEKRDILLKMLLSLIEKDIDMLVEALNSLGLVVEESQLDAFKDDLYVVLIENESKPIKPDTGLLDDLVLVLRKYHLTVPTSVMLMIKVFGMVQDVCSKLYPEFVLIKEAKPLLEKSLKSRIVKEANIRHVGLTMVEEFEKIKELPKNANTVLKQLSKGYFILKIPDKDLEELERIADRTSYRILIGLVLSSIVMGMSFVVLAEQSVLAAESLQIAVIVYVVAVLILVVSTIQLMRARDKRS